jgi:hypothetical protein
LSALVPLAENKARTEARWQEAYDGVMFIADNIGSADLRDTFLGRPDFRQLLENNK